MIEEAIKKINPNAQFTVDQNDVNQITWLNGTTPIAVSDIQAKITELENEYNNNAYQRNRASEYPNIAEQLDKLYHDINNGTLTTSGDFYSAINAVKTKYPKPSE